MIDRFRVHRPDQRNVVGNGRSVRQNLAEPHAAFAMLSELEGGRDTGLFLLLVRHLRQSLTLTNGLGQFLAMKVLQLRLVIEQIDVRRTARLEQIDDSFRFAHEMG